VFVYDGNIGWIIGNVGGGPAMNVIVAQVKGKEPWFNPVRIPPLAKDKVFIPLWLHHVNSTGLGCIYTDFEDRFYTSTCRGDNSLTFRGRRFGPWKKEETGIYWNHPKYQESDVASA
jgi:hypothetical protein